MVDTSTLFSGSFCAELVASLGIFVDLDIFILYDVVSMYVDLFVVEIWFFEVDLDICTLVLEFVVVNG